MLVDERRRRILELIEESEFASLSDLVGRIDASESTVRRDLEYLEQFGQIRRTRGGATFLGDQRGEPNLVGFNSSETPKSRQKSAIARRVSQLVGEAEVVLLDGGTTTLEVARELAGRTVQVVTNSIPIANLLVNRPETELIFLGGTVSPRSGVALGPLLKSALRDIHVRRLIMGAGGVTADGLYNGNTLLVEAEREMMRVAEETILVCDSGKFGHVALVHLCSLKEVDRVVTDSGISSEWQQILRSADVELEIVEL